MLICSLFRLLNTVDDTTKGLPIVGGVTNPLLKTVGGVTDELPIVSQLSHQTSSLSLRQELRIL